MSQYKIIITGASGFIGTNLLEKLVEDNNNVINIDINHPRNTKHLKYYKHIDIMDYKSLAECVNNFNPDYIVHLAARTDLDGKTLKDYSINSIGVENILKVSKQSPGLKKIIITSSQLVSNAEYKPKNQFDYHPTTVYGESKVITEENVWNNKPNCDWAIIRPTSIWGEWFGIPYRNFFDMVVSKRYFHFGKKSATKTYGYIGNTIYQIEKILFSNTSDENNKVFYLGDVPPINIKEWANEIANILHYKIVTVPYILIFMAAICGDLLKNMGVSFPMTTYRLHNMMTDNIIDLSNTIKLVPESPYTRIQGIIKTLEWLHSK
jgi:nucleoside-diphosphate-sugar epimerase